MASLNRYNFLLITLLLLIMSCSSNGNENMEEIIPEIIPSNLIISIEIIGKNTSTPNGDGSGKIKVTASATNGISYKFQFENDMSIENTNGTVEYTYTKDGLHSYNITVFAYSNTDNVISHFRKVDVLKQDLIINENEDNLLWSDEFDTDGAPNSNKWTYDLGDGCPNVCNWGNGEAQYYTNRSENVLIKDGILKITAKRENYQGLGFTSTRLKTQGKFSFTYGRVEVRAKLPIGKGTWPAIWMLGDNITTVGWPACGEIDIMEHVGKNQGTVQSAMHTPSSSGNTINHGATFINDVSTKFHVYAVQWTSEKIEFFVDDNSIYTYNPSVKNASTWPYTANQFIILNIAMGGGFGGAIDNSFTESSMEIDYVRVYQ